MGQRARAYLKGASAKAAKTKVPPEALPAVSESLSLNPLESVSITTLILRLTEFSSALEFGTNSKNILLDVSLAVS